MLTARRQRIFALLLLLTLAGHWSLFRMQSPLNNWGTYQPEWPLIADILISFPLAYFLLFRPSLRQFLKAWAMAIAGGILFGSLIIPSAAKHIWLTLDYFRPVLPIIGAITEFAVLILLVRKTRAILRMHGDVDASMAHAIRGKFGTGLGAKAILFEARIWYYGLFMRRPPIYAGALHFFYAKVHGNASNQAAWIALLVFDIPVSHMLLHFMASPALAWLGTVLTLWTLLYLVAEYRATHVRPVSLAADALLVRCGVLGSDASIPYAAIAGVRPIHETPRRQPGVRLFRHQGIMNVELQLHEGSVLPTLFSAARPYARVWIGLDQPHEFIAALQHHLPQPITS